MIIANETSDEETLVIHPQPKKDKDKDKKKQNIDKDF